MRRWSFRIAVAGCIVISLAGAGALIRGCFARDLLEWRWYTAFRERGGSGFRQHVLRLEVISQSIAIDHAANWQPADAGVSFDRYATAAGPIVKPKLRAASRSHPSGRDWYVEFPSWLLLSPLLLPLARQLDQRLRTVRQRRMLRAGICPSCGYDLRASKDRCPECGRVIEFSDNFSGRRNDGGTT
jgi:hypothetical protein